MTIQPIDPSARSSYPKGFSKPIPIKKGRVDQVSTDMAFADLLQEGIDRDKENYRGSEHIARYQSEVAFRDKKTRKSLKECLDSKEYQKILRGYTPTFSSDHLQEKFNYLGTYSGISVYDCRHAVEEFKRHFPDLTMDDFRDILKRGMKEISELHDLKANNYLIKSKKDGVMFPIEIRPDEYKPEVTIGALATTRSPDELKDLRNEIHVIVEQGPSYVKIPLCEKFNYFIEDGFLYADFDVILV